LAKDSNDNHTHQWQPSADRAMLQARAAILAQIREFFAARNVLEVETPVLSQAGTTDPNIESFQTHYNGPGLPPNKPLYLATSPEFHMKRLLAAGSGDIYQISRVFRQGEFGRWHNPEFSLLEWYRTGFDVQDLMQEVAQLVSRLLAPEREFRQCEYISYRDAFQCQLGIDPFLTTTEQLRQCAEARHMNVSGLDRDDRDAWLDLLMSHHVQQHLGKQCLCFVYDYPASQAALARIRPGEPAVAERFELFVDGSELANGFHELDDAVQQAQRFRDDLLKRQRCGQMSVPQDGRFISALEQGLPDCSGVALGLDRLIQIKFGTKTLHDCMAFPIDRA